jgi:hypothetical protein
MTVPSQYASIKIARRLVSQAVNEASEQACLASARSIVESLGAHLPSRFVASVEADDLHAAMVVVGWHLGETEDEVLTPNDRIVRQMLRRWRETVLIFTQE